MNNKIIKYSAIMLIFTIFVISLINAVESSPLKTKIIHILSPSRSANNHNMFNFLIKRNHYSNEFKELYFANHLEEKKRKTVRILSIDGGGIRGIIPLTILSQIEDQTQQPIANLFDVVSGTSTGGIISLALNISDKDGNPKYTARYLQDLYKNKNEQAFPQNFLLKKLRKVPLLSEILNTFQSKYSHKKIEKFFAEEFSTTLISQAISTVIVPTYDIKDSRIRIFNNHNNSLISRIDNNSKNEDFYMKDIARATSAAPTYFLPAKIQPANHDPLSPNEYKYVPNKSYYLIDGGVAANNPTLIAYSHALMLYPEANDFLIVSLGTGTRTIGFLRYSDLASSPLEGIKTGAIKGSGFFGWARKLPGLMINAPSSASEYCLRILSSKHYFRYHRFHPELPQELTALDSTHQEIIEDLIDFGNNTFRDHSQQDELIEELRKKRSYAGSNGILKPGIHLSNNDRENDN